MAIITDRSRCRSHYGDGFTLDDSISNPSIPNTLEDGLGYTPFSDELAIGNYCFGQKNDYSISNPPPNV